MHRRLYFVFLFCWASALGAVAQRSFSLRADELRIDSVLPHFTFVQELGPDFADSVYSFTIEYPEFAPMKRREARRYRKLTGERLPEWPAVDSYVGVSRRQASLYGSFVPLLRRDGKNMKMTAFQVKVSAQPKSAIAQGRPRRREATTASSRLATGKWVKISVPETGIYELTDSLLLAAGFAEPDSVKVYGYGGALQPEALSAAYLAETDDLPQVPLYSVGGRRLFHAQGPVSWEKAETLQRTRNHYSVEGCYFLSDNNDEPLLLDSVEFAASCYPSAADYHALYEVDDFSWFHGGRQLYDRRLYGTGVARSYVLPSHVSEQGWLTVSMSYAGYCDAVVSVADSVVGHILLDKSTTEGSGKKQFTDSYSKAAADVWTFPLSNLTADSLVVTIQQTSGAEMRLDYIALTFDQPCEMPSLTDASFPEPALLGDVANQNRHADSAVDMVIIIPASGLLQAEAERLAQLHETYDGMRVRVVRADELYNEFSSGTPDINAYRRYLKMLYDRAESEADMPRFLLLFGDAVYDNRMLTSNFSQLQRDDFLLCYESDNSFSETACYVSDDFITLLDNGEGADIIKTDKSDVAVGRFPVRTPEEAKIMVDKAYSYRLNEHAGAWQNSICIMGDDGNANMHMNDAESVATMISDNWPAYNVKKVFWDAYQRVSSSRGESYPDVTNLIRQQMSDGALLMNYSGHGSARSFSHEYVVELNDFKNPTSLRLPLWFTASCDIAPFDGYEENIAEQAVLNPNGGAFSFIGTTRTVYAVHNRALNRAFSRYVLTADSAGGRYAVGEALRMAKNDQVLGIRTVKQAGINKLHYALLGDPAISLAFPTMTAVVDTINGMAVADGTVVTLLAGDTATVKGYIPEADDFSGLATLTVKDAEQTITCRMNPLSAEETPKAPLVYNDRPVTLYVGNDSVRQGRFSFTFAVPKDISYADAPGQMLVYAVDDAHLRLAHGVSEDFVMASADDYEAEGEGPVVTAWLDSPAFVDGDIVSDTPLLHIELSDSDGINASGSGIGHDMELVVDNMMRMTYNLNSYFQYDFGDYRNGSIDFTLPQLADGMHELLFRAWDVLNNSTVLRLSFGVGPTTAPSGIDELHAAATEADEYFDLQGRRVGRVQGGQFLLQRSEGGKVKKKFLHKQ